MTLELGGKSPNLFLDDADFAAAVPHVLVLDDNSMITDMLGSMLDMFGYRAATANAGDRALEMLDLSEPPVDFVALASGLGVPASRVETAEDLSAALARSFATPGPCLIEAMVPSAF